ncbi:MAG: hypothetical protein H7Y17_10765, partial [Chlorobia bacterium]|nr:hypothetical protein [Fimbriimonadaceae bacterium]
FGVMMMFLCWNWGAQNPLNVESFGEVFKPHVKWMIFPFLPVFFFEGFRFWHYWLGGFLAFMAAHFVGQKHTARLSIARSVFGRIFWALLFAALGGAVIALFWSDLVQIGLAIGVLFAILAQAPPWPRLKPKRVLPGTLAATLIPGIALYLGSLIYPVVVESQQLKFIFALAMTIPLALYTGAIIVSDRVKMRREAGGGSSRGASLPDDQMKSARVFESGFQTTIVPEVQVVREENRLREYEN